VRCEAGKKRKAGVHTLYKNIFDFSDYICGVYEDLVTFRDGELHEVKF
jgi:hypothetical protein